MSHTQKKKAFSCPNNHGYTLESRTGKQTLLSAKDLAARGRNEEGADDCGLFAQSARKPKARIKHEWNSGTRLFRGGTWSS